MEQSGHGHHEWRMGYTICIPDGRDRDICAAGNRRGEPEGTAECQCDSKTVVGDKGVREGRSSDVMAV